MEGLVWRFNLIDKEWKMRKLLIIDNAAIHCCKAVKEYIEINRIPVLYTGVASFNAIPVELVFAHIKKKLQSSWEKKLNQDIIEGRRHFE